MTIRPYSVALSLDTVRPLVGRRLRAARATWLLLTSAVLVMWGVDAAQRAPAWTIGEQIFGLAMPAAFFAMAGIIFWRKSADPMALLVALMLAYLGPYLLSGVSSQWMEHPSWVVRLVTIVLVNIGGTLTGLFVALFPSGTFVPRWVRLVTALAIALMVVLTVVELVQGLGQTLSPVGLALYLPFGLAAQVIRYRRHSTAAQRQQTKWIVAGFLCAVVAFLSWLLTPPPLWRAIENSPVYSMLYYLAQSGLFLCLPLAIGVSILRYRLWDIDLIIRRAALYSVLTTALALVYLGTILLLQTLFRAVTGQAGQLQLTIVISTLAMAALFGPLRSRLQTAIDRRFYRNKYNAAATLAGFGAAIRDQTNLDALTSELVEVVDETMQPETISLWLTPASGA